MEDAVVHLDTFGISATNSAHFQTTSPQFGKLVNAIKKATNVLEQADNHCQQEQATLDYHRDNVEISVNNEVIPDATNAVEKADNHCQEKCIHVHQAATLSCVHQVAFWERMQWATTLDYVR